mmetsp:Transcript_76532/g.236339  ORF Transcript_76532/g.236339 Transcript_76532/m.236339 type:complete len:258 (+) Transcript_76532:53-826(+)
MHPRTRLLGVCSGRGVQGTPGMGGGKRALSTHRSVLEHSRLSSFQRRHPGFSAQVHVTTPKPLAGGAEHEVHRRADGDGGLAAATGKGRRRSAFEADVVQQPNARAVQNKQPRKICEYKNSGPEARQAPPHHTTTERNTLATQQRAPLREFAEPLLPGRARRACKGVPARFWRGGALGRCHCGRVAPGIPLRAGKLHRSQGRSGWPVRPGDAARGRSACRSVAASTAWISVRRAVGHWQCCRSPREETVPDLRRALR